MVINKSSKHSVTILTYMHTYIRILSRVANRYAPSRPLSFDAVHVFKSLQVIKNGDHASRAILGKELALGEGSVKTLIKHLKMNDLVVTTNGGTRMTRKGEALCNKISSLMPAEVSLQSCSIALGRFNHAVLVKELGYAIRSGIEQRDAAIKMGGTGATTLLFRENKLVMPTSSQDCLVKEPKVRQKLVDELQPVDGDVIIVGSSNKDMITARLAALNAALNTILDHEKH
jgi:hypothetical protein